MASVGLPSTFTGADFAGASVVAGSYPSYVPYGLVGGSGKNKKKTQKRRKNTKRTKKKKRKNTRAKYKRKKYMKKTGGAAHPGIPPQGQEPEPKVLKLFNKVNGRTRYCRERGRMRSRDKGSCYDKFPICTWDTDKNRCRKDKDNIELLKDYKAKLIRHMGTTDGESNFNNLVQGEQDKFLEIGFEAINKKIKWTEIAEGRSDISMDEGKRLRKEWINYIYYNIDDLPPSYLSELDPDTLFELLILLCNDDTVWAAAGNRDKGKRLIEAGAHTDILNDERESPLLCAVRAGNADMVELLLDQNLVYTINQVYENDMTPLLYAISFSIYNRDKIINLLVNAPGFTDINRQDVTGYTALDRVRASGEDRFVVIIEERLREMGLGVVSSDARTNQPRPPPYEEPFVPAAHVAHVTPARVDRGTLVARRPRKRMYVSKEAMETREELMDDIR